MIQRSLLLCLALGVAGCQTTTGSTPVAQPAPSQGIPVARAVSLFEKICMGSLPKFESAQKLMKANGIDQPSPMGTQTLYSASGNVSFLVLEGPGAGNTCSMVVTTTEPKSKINAAIKPIGPFKKTDIGMISTYKTSLVLSRITTAPDSLNVLNLRILSSR